MFFLWSKTGYLTLTCLVFLVMPIIHWIQNGCFIYSIYHAHVYWYIVRRNLSCNYSRTKAFKIEFVANSSSSHIMQCHVTEQLHVLIMSLSKFLLKILVTNFKCSVWRSRNQSESYFKVFQVRIHFVIP